MREIIINENLLNENDINKKKTRVKCLLINSENKLILGFCNNRFQFPGGHLKENESLSNGLIREIKEETGIEIENKDYDPYLKIIYYINNYHNQNINIKNIIYYYFVKTDDKINPMNTNFDKEEIAGRYELRIIDINDAIMYLQNNLNDDIKGNNIIYEMITAIEEYKKLEVK